MNHGTIMKERRFTMKKIWNVLCALGAGILATFDRDGAQEIVGPDCDDQVPVRSRLTKSLHGN
jgi:hypothetical protein